MNALLVCMSGSHGVQKGVLDLPKLLRVMNLPCECWQPNPEYLQVQEVLSHLSSPSQFVFDSASYQHEALFF